MTLSQIMEYIMLLPANQKQVIMEMLMQEAGEIEGDYHPLILFQSDGWKEVSKRAEEVVKEKKTCLIHFDDHIQLLN